MKKNYFITVLAASFMVLSSIQSCVHESLETKMTSVNQDPLSFIKNEYLRGKDMIAGKQIDWSKTQTFKNREDIILITVPIKNLDSHLIEKLTFRIHDGKVSGHLWKYESENTFADSDYKLSSHEIMNGFSGTVSYISLEGSMRYRKKMIRGEFIDEITSKNGNGPITAPSCNICHIADIEPVVIPSPGGGNNDPNPPIPGTGTFNPQNPGNPSNPEDPNSPCKKIKDQKNKQDFSQKLNDLKNKQGLTKETGYSQRANGNYTYHDNASANSNSNSLSLPRADLPENKDITGYMHTHVDDITTTNSNGDLEIRRGIKMFSPADVAYFMDMLSNAQAAGRPLTDVYAVMVSSNGMYQLRFVGNQYQIKLFTQQQINGFTESYINAMLDSKNPEASFLKFIDEKMNVKATNLYKMNVNASGATAEIKLNSDKQTTSTSNCP